MIPRTLTRSSRPRVTAPWTHERGSLVEARQVNETCKLELQPACMEVTAAKFSALKNQAMSSEPVFQAATKQKI